MRSAWKCFVLALPFVAACAASSKPEGDAKAKPDTVEETPEEQQPSQVPDLEALVQARAR